MTFSQRQPQRRTPAPDIEAQLAALKKREAQLHAIIQTEPECVKLVGRRGELLEMNPAGLAMLEAQSFEEVRSQPLLNFIASEHREAFVELHRRVMRGEGGTLVFEVIGIRGKRRWLETHATPLRLEGEAIEGLLGITRDVTAQRAAEEKLWTTNRALKAMSQSNHALLHATFEDQLLGDVCRIVSETCGFPLAWVGLMDAKGVVRQVASAGHLKNAFAASGSDVAIRCRAVLDAITEKRPACVPDFEASDEGEPCRLCARRHGVNSALALPLIVEGDVVGVFCVYSTQLRAFDAPETALLLQLSDDLAFGLKTLRAKAEQRRAQEALRESEQRFRQLAENIREVFWLSDVSKTRILHVSPAYEEVWGRSCASLYSDPGSWLEAVHPDDWSRINASVAKQADGGYAEEYRIVRPDGTLRWIRDRAFPVRDIAGDVYRIAGIAEDVSESKRLETQLLQMQRLEAIGQLASGIAHDINNILTPIMMAAPLLRTKSSPADAENIINTIETSAKRGAEMVRQLLLVGCEGGSLDNSVSVGAIIHELEAVIRQTFPANIAIESYVPDNLPVIRGNGTQVFQALLNLCVNARDAMPAGGRVVIRARVTQPREALGEWKGDASHLAVSVSDSGGGIPPGVRDKIFEPFFTTKSPGRGTGLGLATVLATARRHGGTLVLETSVGAGAEFHLLLPLQPQASVG